MTVSSHPGVNPAGSAAAYRLNYSMTGWDGQPAAAQALVFVPAGTAPAGGWKVLVWGHGTTTGAADACAPSASADLMGGYSAVDARMPRGYLPVIESMLANGYAVVAPDFEGLGTASPFPYYHLGSGGRSMVVAAQAAHKAVAGLARQWVAVGHSAGAQATLGATQVHAEAPELDFRGAVTLALFVGVADSVTAQVTGPSPNPVAANLIVGLFSTTVQTQDAAFRFGDVFGADMAALAGSFQQDCAGTSAGKIFGALGAAGGSFQGHAAGWAANPQVESFLAANDPARLPSLAVRKPLLIIQGTGDEFGIAPAVATLASRLAAAGAPVTYLPLAGDHYSVLQDGSAAMFRWIGAAFD